MMNEQWWLEFYRTSQASTYEEAKETGALRVYPVDPPVIDETIRSGPVGDLMDVIDMGVEMMDSCEVINYYLTRDGKVMDKEEFGMSTWDLLTDEQKVARVRSEVEAKPVTQVDPAWEKAMNDLADEKQALRDMLDNLVTLWSFQAPLAEMESAMLRASVLLKSTKTEA
tara:strand:+ start:1417 stop:1923 length:507 start_codon:yes stop_codon:yes gene_type:complete